MSDAMISVAGLHKSYRMGRVDLHVLRGVSFAVARGEFVSIVGASGSGKSTLLHLMGLLDRPDKGTVHVDGRDTSRLGAGGRTRMRRDDIGFVFQFYHLLPELNVLENVQIAQMTGPGLVRWLGQRRQARQRADEILDRVGLSGRLKHRPSELSGGERQRVALARALVNAPKVLLADEPTGNLDRRTGGEILEVIKSFNRDVKQTLVMVTHDPELAAMANRVVHLVDGKLK
jgi:lipoprotein-releasing system ATP-binding protein